MEIGLGTKPKYVSVKEAAAYFGCSADAIRSDYTRDPENCKGVIYKGGYRCCLEEMEQGWRYELIRRNPRSSLKAETTDRMRTASSETSRIPKTWDANA